MSFRLMLLLVLAGSTFGAVPVVRIGVENNSPPLSYIDDARQPEGFAAALLQAMTETGHVRCELVPSSWSFIEQEFNAGRLDALANVVITDERRATMDFSIGHATIHSITYTRPGLDPIRRTSQFAGRTMATLSGTIMHQDALRHGDWGAHIVKFNSWREMLEAVRRGDCDFALLMRPLKFEQPDELGLRREFVEDHLYTFHIAVHRGDRERLAAINEALAQLQRNGTFDRIYAAWIGPIEPHPIRLNDLRPYALPAAGVFAFVVLLFWWQRRINRQLRRQARALLSLIHI